VKDGFTTNDIWFATAMMYVFGDEALTKMTNQAAERLKAFHLDIPSLDAEDYYREYQAGTFAISDLKAFTRSYSTVVKCMKDMMKSGQPVWVSPAWIAGRGR
jgi:hypothetical protein